MLFKSHEKVLLRDAKGAKNVGTGADEKREKTGSVLPRST